MQWLSFSSDRSKHEESFLSSEDEEEVHVQPKINIKQHVFGNDYMLGNESIGTANLSTRLSIGCDNLVTMLSRPTDNLYRWLTAHNINFIIIIILKGEPTQERSRHAININNAKKLGIAVLPKLSPKEQKTTFLPRNTAPPISLDLDGEEEKTEKVQPMELAAQRLGNDYVKELLRSDNIRGNMTHVKVAINNFVLLYRQANAVNTTTKKGGGAGRGGASSLKEFD